MNRETEAAALLCRLADLLAVQAALRLECETLTHPNPVVTELAVVVHATQTVEQLWFKAWQQTRGVGQW